MFLVADVKCDNIDSSFNQAHVDKTRGLVKTYFIIIITIFIYKCVVVRKQLNVDLDSWYKKTV